MTVRTPTATLPILTALAISLTAVAPLAGELKIGAGAEAEIGAGTGAQIGAETDATAKVRELVDEPQTDADGIEQAETGGAEPTENWFGCQPSETEQEASCDDGASSQEEARIESDVEGGAEIVR